MTRNACSAVRRVKAGYCGWLLAGLVLFGGGGWTVAAAQDVIAAGYNHSCAVIYGGLQCWGGNDYGQLGNGTTRSSNVTTRVALNGTVTAVAAGGYHTCAVVNGGLFCWGYNGSGALGNGSTDDSTTPVPVLGLDSNVAAVAAGNSHTCAVVSGGLKCWGFNGNGELGIGDTNPSETPIEVFPSGSGVTSVSAGSVHSCAVVSGEAYCWGYNGEGQLGTGNQDDALTPIPVIGISSAVVGIAAGGSHTCALLDTSGVQCWGSNWDGQLGDGSFSQSLVPVTVHRDSFSTPPLLGATAITAGQNHTCAATSNGAYCWGYNETGQLGIGSTQDSALAKPVSGPGGDMTAMAAGGAHTCAAANGAVVCWGSDESGQLGDAAASPYVPVPTIVPDDLHNVSAGRAHGCAMSAGGAYCWGSNHYGQLGNGTLDDGTAPWVVSGLEPGSNVTLLAAGDYHSCAIWYLAAYVSCWGRNGHGQLGNGQHDDSSTPVAVDSLSGAVSIDAGGYHTCAVGSGGNVQCWGTNGVGELGNGTSSSSSFPVTVQIGSPFPVPLSGAMAVTAGGSHSCAVVNGGAYCWGRNASGQLGSSSTSDSHWAAQVTGLGPGSSVTMISAGEQHTCAVVNGGAQCWGSNGYGRLGNGTGDDSAIPVSVYGLDSAVSAVASGNKHTCAVVEDGVKCWGYNRYGQLGNGTFDGSNVPVTALPAGSGVTTITAGENYTCATGTVAGAATTWCWGTGMFGRLANGELGYKDVPVAVIDRIFRHGFGGD